MVGGVLIEEQGSSTAQSSSKGKEKMSLKELEDHYTQQSEEDRVRFLKEEEERLAPVWASTKKIYNKFKNKGERVKPTLADLKGMARSLSQLEDEEKDIQLVLDRHGKDIVVDECGMWSQDIDDGVSPEHPVLTLRQEVSYDAGVPREKLACAFAMASDTWPAHIPCDYCIDPRFAGQRAFRDCTFLEQFGYNPGDGQGARPWIDTENALGETSIRACINCLAGGAPRATLCNFRAKYEAVEREREEQEREG